VLRDFVFPVLRRAVNYYLHFLTKDSCRAPTTCPRRLSPEYASSKDCNYDLALIHWGVGTLLASATRLGITDPLASKWQDVLDHLVKPPQDADGFRIGADVTLTSGHRHYSHLLWFYPLYRLDVTTSPPTGRRSRSRSTTGSASPAPSRGTRSRVRARCTPSSATATRPAHQMITLLDKYVQANTMYKESGPVIETPLSGAQTMHDMLVQSWGSTIRVFPGVPSAWANVTVHNFRTEGAFLVSAVRRRRTDGFRAGQEPGRRAVPGAARRPRGSPTTCARWPTAPRCPFTNERRRLAVAHPGEETRTS
jgi:alpha-L-fucosidase 2